MPLSYFLIIQHGPERLGIDLDAVREVARMVLPQSLPGAPRGVLGFANFRGEAIPVVELEQRLSAGAPPPGLDYHLVVVDCVSMTMAFAVSHVIDIEPLPAEAVRPARAGLPPGFPLLGVAELGGSIVPLLDVEALMSAQEVVELREAVAQLTGADS